MAGVGITPMMSTLRHLTETLCGRPIVLIYAVRTLDEVIFRDELRMLQARHPNFSLHLLPNETDDPNWTGRTGYLTPAMLAAFALDIARQRMHLCGPAAMMTAVAPMLAQLGVQQSAVFAEAFTAQPPDGGEGADAAVTITFQRSARTMIARRGGGILRVAAANGVTLAQSCRTDECGSCRCKLVAGEVDMPDKPALTAKERAAGLILVCVARPTSDAVVLDL